MPVEYILAFALGIFGSARLTRLITQDIFPPTAAIRDWIGDHWPEKWALLFHCHWCFGFWANLINLTAGWFSDLHPLWWFANLAFAGSYFTSWIVNNDEGFVLVHDKKEH